MLGRMATQGERRALIFLAAVALLGAGSRVWRARHVQVPNEALDHQLNAVDSATASLGAHKNARQPPSQRVEQPPARIDLDVARAGEIEKLPGVGPSLARRIVADRDAKGAFGCLGALDSIKGIGPAMLARLDSLAVFSGPPRAVCAMGADVPRESPERRPSRRRGR
jgi:DNA uptake protein ComE-like DNA-binding protein